MFVALLMFVFTCAMLQVVVAYQKILFIGYGINWSLVVESNPKNRCYSLVFDQKCEL